MKFDTHNLILEGPDLSGKTTIYSLLHEKTEFSRNIQDRSCLSMLCYAILYDRNIAKWRKNLHRELSNLNNRAVILLPNFSILTKRYHLRGDEIQNLSSLKELYNIFNIESKKLNNLPTVKVINNTENPHIICNKIIKWLKKLECANPHEVGSVIRNFVVNSEKDEYVLDVDYQGSLTDCDSILHNENEGDYYTSILTNFKNKIVDELNGDNPYHLPQTFNSRRFYYNSDSCISSLHLLPRDYKVDLVATLRSTDIVRNASIDFEFLNFLLSHFTKSYFKPYDIGTLRVRFNSAHIRRDLD
jgi:hypothetical protein